MALTLPDAGLCGIVLFQCCSGVRLRSMIVCKFGRGYQNAFCGRMRFNNLLFRISKLCSRTKHKFAEKLLEDVDKLDPSNVSDRSKLLTKVSVLMDYDGFNDFIENEAAKRKSGGILNDNTDDFDVSLACKRFPSIVLGNSLPVELYDETKSDCGELPLAAEDYEAFYEATVSTKWVDPVSVCKQWPSADILANVDSPISKESRDDSSWALGESREETTDTTKVSKEENVSLDSQYMTLESEEISDNKVGAEDASATLGPELPVNLAFLDASISCIPGLRNRQCHQLENCGFHTIRKLLHHFPRTYADLQNAQVGVNDGLYLRSVGKVLSSRGIRAGYSFSFLEVVVGCEVADNESDHQIDDIDRKDKKTIYLHLKKFFRGTRFASLPFLKRLEQKHQVGDLVCVSGKVKTMQNKDHFEMREYSIDVLKEDEDSTVHVEGRPYPIYPSKGGLNPDLLRDIITRAIQSLPTDIDPIPKEITQEFGLLSLHEAYNGIHQPKNVEEADLSRKRLIFDEFFYLQLGRLYQMLEGLGTRMEKDGLLDKYRKPESNTVCMEEWSSLTKNFLKVLPYPLTSSQLNAVCEIIWDLKRPVPMNRLLQGDVGCGKTVVAFLACMEVIGSGYQAAFMVPTELLAVQHYELLLNLLESLEEGNSKPSVALLTGSTPLKQSRMIRQDLQTGEISMVIGTHSLISESVDFSALRIAVVDEQHRFGVIQRGRFNSKLYCSPQSSRAPASSVDESSKGDGHMAPVVLGLSATPIPRTLALALYGDMSLTQITDLPPGRIPVETCIIEGNYDGFEDVYKMMLDELGTGGRVYLVYPVIELSEQLPQLRAAAADLETISNRFQNYNCGLLHGRMKSDEKDEALRRFRSGETHILLSTQVIEVGVDIPDASMMVVMNAERFGIAQLHQLRGRVGRGARKSKCVLITSTTSSLDRLKVLEKSADGFYLANMDLLLRGPGDLLGKKQSGHLPEFPIARLEIDGNIIQEAHAAALKILSNSHDLEQFPALKAELSMRQPLCLLGD